jgi:hypothetical protein
MTQQESFDIVDLIEKNPITRLSKTYQSNLIRKIQESFGDNQQQLFVASFFTYLNYNSKCDFIIDLDNVWKWLGFSRKDPAKRILEKHFRKEKDYKILLHQVVEKVHGGNNKEQIMMNIETFKKLCLKAGTKRADEIHDYYIKLEEIMHQLVHEESAELRLQLEQKDTLLVEQKEQSELEKRELFEKTIVEQLPRNTQCIYYGHVDNVDLNGKKIIKFGMSNDFGNRLKQHKKTYNNFRLINAIKVPNHIEIENCIKKHPDLKRRLRIVTIDNIAHRELICIDPDSKDPEFSLEKFEAYIKEIIDQNVYNLENYKKLLTRVEDLESDNYTKDQRIKELESQIQKLQSDKNKYALDPYLQRKITKENNSETMHGYTLFAFRCNSENPDIGTGTFKVDMCKNLTLEMREKTYKTVCPDGNIVKKELIKHPFLEKTFVYLLKRHLTNLNKETYTGSINDIQTIFNIISKLETLIINNDLFNLLNFLENKTIALEHNNPEIPFVRKAKRSIDQIEPTTGKVLCTFESIEAAGRALGLTTGTAIGVALRNKSLCKGYMWRYSGITNEDQMGDQPVTRICCKTGERTEYNCIASAARASCISPPCLRNRILTELHINGYHWVFNKEASHYNAVS